MTSLWEQVTSFRERRRHRVSVCFQTQVSDCGPACLVMTLGLHGIDVDLATVRARADSGRNGSSARSLLEIAREHGLRGRGVRAELDALPKLSPGAILFWNFNHFVVLEAATRDHVDIVDPAFGRRRLSRAAVAEAFTGVALEFDPPIDRPRARSRRAGKAGPWRRLAQFLPGRRELAGLAGASAALMAFELALPLTTSFLVEQVAPERAMGKLGLLASVLAGLCVLFLVLQVTRSFLVTKRQALIEKRLTQGVVDHLTSLPYDYFTVRNSGDLAMRARTSSSLTQVLSLTAVSAACDSVLIVVYLVVIVLTNPLLAGLVVLLIGIQLGVLVLTWRRQATLNQEVLERQAKTQEELVEMLESITSLKSSGMEAYSAQRWSHTLVAEVNKRLGTRRSLAVATGVSRAVQFGAPLLVVLVGVLRVLSGDGSLGTALAFMTLTIALFVPLEGVFDAASQLATVRPTLARLDDVLNAEPEPRGTMAGVGVDQPGRITATGVAFRYSGAPKPALHDVNLTVEPGQFVAVIGRSGSGKSTLGMLLAGLYVSTAGTITVDGIDLTELDRPTFRRQIGYINQNAHLFGGSIRENILFGAEDLDRRELIDAIHGANVHDEIQAMPMGYNTLVGPSGHGLSGGQRQRIVLARALAKKPKLLILDEATSALDPALEQRILHDLLESGITVVAIAHRLTVLDRADQVIVMRDGRIVASGSPAALREGNEEFLCLT
ncbi:peptidase domain-containing ABC transporter [Kutzneria sp. CA-103260]|uniref:peptidase domain-containing ABC transporter n=1 Tax=Kutzneria sp. CA-103260 TaxID=2802641 RepID=UPI001BA8AC24|nr:peptidase domain-containing ABC transporter [Kutzneria sp. CA-103260]QUQ68832.1 ABC transporter [Kutzneria sp. CA-103260]